MRSIAGTAKDGLQWRLTSIRRIDQASRKRALEGSVSDKLIKLRDEGEASILRSEDPLLVLDGRGTVCNSMAL